MVSLQEKINNAISTGNVSELSDVELNQLINQFPYCGIFKELQSKLYHSEKNYQAESVINNSSIYIGNRSAFFDFVFKQTLQNTFEKVAEKISSEQTDISFNSNTLEELESEKEKNLEESRISEPKTEEPLLVEPAEKSKIEEEEIIPKTSEAENKTSNSATGNIENEEMLKALEKQIIASAVSSSISLDASEEFSEDLEDAKVEEKTTLKNTNQKLSFSSWLKSFDSKNKNEGEKKHKRELIEKFIQNDPQITPKQTQFFSAPEKAKLSLAEDETFVTETLAELYAKQGNISKAIKAFKILMDANTEKKAFFAARIQELKSSNKK